MAKQEIQHLARKPVTEKYKTSQIHIAYGVRNIQHSLALVQANVKIIYQINGQQINTI